VVQKNEEEEGMSYDNASDAGSGVCIATVLIWAFDLATYIHAVS
jgi:hypothetical protein